MTVPVLAPEPEPAPVLEVLATAAGPGLELVSSVPVKKSGRNPVVEQGASVVGIAKYRPDFESVERFVKEE